MKLVNGWRYERESRRFVWFADGQRVTALPAHFVADGPSTGWFPRALARRCPPPAPRRPSAARLRRAHARVRMLEAAWREIDALWQPRVYSPRELCAFYRIDPALLGVPLP